MIMWLNRLVSIEDYSEAEIQQAIEHFWPCLFQRYELCTHLRREAMPGTWRPDILAAETKTRYGSTLIIELKGFRPSSSFVSTIDQVITYGLQFHRKYPGAAVRLVVIGPWTLTEEERRVRSLGYTVQVLSLQRIGADLSKLAADMLLWSAKSPWREAIVISTEDRILTIPAITDPAEIE